MNTFIIAISCVLVFFIWYSFNTRKLKARIERIERIRVHLPDARIGYMNLKGRKFTWKITIESVKPNGEDWIITAWCHEQKDFLVFYASRIYQYFDLTQYREIKNIHEYLTARFGRKSRSKGA